MCTASPLGSAGEVSKTYARQRRNEHPKKPLRKGRKEKFSHKFMVYGVITDASCLNYFHCVRKRNKRRSRIKNDDLKRKYTFHEENVDQYEVNEGAKSFIHNVKTRGLKLILGDCDAKLQAKSLGLIMKKNGVPVYLAAGKKMW